MTSRVRIALAVIGAVGFFIAVQVGALWLHAPFDAAGFQAVEDPSDPANAVLYVGVLLLATVGMLGLLTYGRTGVLRAGIVLTSGMIAAYVFAVLLPPVVPLGGAFHLAAVLGGGLVVLGLWAYPEWWVIDGAALIMGMGAAALFGISLDVLPVLVLLVVLAVYDAVSVYGTEHMLTLASGVMELRVPVLIVIPTTTGFSFRELAASVEDEKPGATDRDSQREDIDAMESETGSEEVRTQQSSKSNPFERDAFFIGLGDAVMPTILVVTATAFLETPTFLGIEIASLGAMVGTVLGLVTLLGLVLRGRPHAGLPLLNGGAIGGYLIGAVLGGLGLLEALGVGSFL
ncbi:MAG: presenilin family intramembrane aspartyl protease PSH [Halodesulfurarchaeum sp.]